MEEKSYFFHYFRYVNDTTQRSTRTKRFDRKTVIYVKRILRIRLFFKVVPSEKEGQARQLKQHRIYLIITMSKMCPLSSTKGDNSRLAIFERTAEKYFWPNI